MRSRFRAGRLIIPPLQLKVKQKRKPVLAIARYRENYAVWFDGDRLILLCKEDFERATGIKMTYDPLNVNARELIVKLGKKTKVVM